MLENNQILVIICIFTLLLIAACSGVGSDSSNGDSAETAVSSVKSGDEIFKKSCSSCHGADLTGGAGPSLEKIASNYSQDDIKDIINHGTGTMFPVSLSDDEIDVLVKWLLDDR